MIFFVTQTRWGGGWPLIEGPETLGKALMRLGITFLRVIASLQVATLCIIAGMACRRTARELAEHDAEMAGSALFDPNRPTEGDRGNSSDDPFSWP